MIQILWYFLQVYWIPIVSVLFLIFAVIIALRNKELQMPDEYSIEATFGEDKPRPRFKDYNDQDEVDLSFFNNCQ